MAFKCGNIDPFPAHMAMCVIQYTTGSYACWVQSLYNHMRLYTKWNRLLWEDFTNQSHRNNSQICICLYIYINLFLIKFNYHLLFPNDLIFLNFEKCDFRKKELPELKVKNYLAKKWFIATQKFQLGRKIWNDFFGKMPFVVHFSRLQGHLWNIVHYNSFLNTLFHNGLMLPFNCLRLLL